VRSAEAIARDKEYFQTKSAIFNALIDSIDLSQLATMDQEAAREEIRDIVAEIIALKSIVSVTTFWDMAPSSRCWRETTSPISW
jgi:pilus assembly protein CpaF